jgi:hypothetical protein
MAAAAAAVLAVLVAIWPGWTLRYLHVLAWPAVALVGIAAFGPALARRVPALNALHLPGGVIATFSEQHTLEIGAADITRASLADAWGPVIDGTEVGPPDSEEDDPVEIASQAVQVLGLITGAFQMQLDFLQVLSTAPEGLTHVASREWFVDAITARPGGDPAGWDTDALLRWLLNSGSITLDPDGHYRLALVGYRVLAALELPGLFVAPKVF